MAHTGTTTADGRIAVVAGLRTPFARQLTDLADLDAVQLGILVTRELLARSDLDPILIERVVYGCVGAIPAAPNIAREVVLGCELDARTDAYSVSRACATGFQAAASVARAIATGEIEVGLAGGADSASVLPLTAAPRLARALIRMSRARSIGQKLSLLRGLRPGDLLPRPPAIRDYSTGLGMGDIAEQMARNWEIPREAQDAFALRSHRLAHDAWEQGRFDAEVMTAFVPPFSAPVRRDNTVRPGSTAEQLAALKPVFDRRHGTVTAGNSSPLTDGAGSLILMRDARARALGLEPLGLLRAWTFVAIDPFNDALMGPSHATARLLDHTGLQLHDMTLIELHEAFASQALANIDNWPSRTFAERVLGRDRPIGEVDMERLNVNGGSIALGHPFAATGIRMIVQGLNELRRRGGGLGLATACAAGGIGVAMVLEVDR